LQSEHQFICKCGRNFKTGKEITEHVTVEAVLMDIKLIGGPRFYAVAKRWEKDPNSRGIGDFANDEGIQIQRDNATLIAKKGIAHMVEHYEDYNITEYQGDGVSILERFHQRLKRTLRTIIRAPSICVSRVRRHTTAS